MKLQIGVGNWKAGIMLVGEAYGAEEELAREPFVGSSGKVLNHLLKAAGIDREQCFITNLVNARPPGNDINQWFYLTKRAAADAGSELFQGRYPKQIILDGLKALCNEIEQVKPKVIIAIGGTPMWALTGTYQDLKSTGITNYRGSQFLVTIGSYTCWLVPTLHPAYLMRGQWSQKPDVLVDLYRAKSLLGTPPRFEPPPKTDLVFPTFAEASQWLNVLTQQVKSEPTKVSVDLETDPDSSLICCCGLTYPTKNGYRSLCLPFWLVNEHPNAEIKNGSYWTVEHELHLRTQLETILTHENCEVVGQYFFAFDWWMFVRWLGFQPNLRWDTYIMQHVNNPGTPKGLTYLSSLYCDEHIYWKDERKDWEKNIESEARMHRYCLKDTTKTLEVAINLEQVLDYSNLQSQYQEILRWAYMSFRMSLRGINIDLEARDELIKNLTAQRIKLKKSINQITEPHTIFATTKNSKGEVSSPACSKYFYEVLECKPIRNKAGRPTASKDALPQILKRNPETAPLINAILQYRSLGTVLSNFLSAGVDIDDRMRCTFNVAGPETFRWSSQTNPFRTGANLQNVTSGGS